ncbi:MAG: DNA recombination/repair protein RecA, partial [Candidatus Omnitrophota bacterium]|nr:DNA recombination/repair protein RecA [Candidatus Omnitrophota bacterium]
IGNRVRAKVVKNKVAPPFREAEFEILHSEGISRIGGILDLAVEIEVIQKSGTWLSFEEVKLGQGREGARAFLKENPKILEKIEKLCREKIKI